MNSKFQCNDLFCLHFSDYREQISSLPDKQQCQVTREKREEVFFVEIKMQISVCLLALSAVSVSSFGMINRISLRPSECNNCGMIKMLILFLCEVDCCDPAQG